ncbi:MAG: hypothetical protein DRP45_09760 [Candidatus Zixiibacteriota bacterium]|nr:MAG: hypothetical protein DRP45_09760 [candidate division Zixibacteria bacterium]
MALLKPKIVVVPMGEVDFMLVNKLATNIGPVYRHSVDILKGMKTPPEAFNFVRNQHYAQVILSKLERMKANPNEKVIAVCEEDLYVPEEAYVMGWGDIVSGCAVVSLFHIRQQFYGLPEDDSKIYPRLFKEVIHHLAHLFNLTECRNPKCVNYFSRQMLDIDNKSDRFCDICRRRLTGVV